MGINLTTENINPV